MNDMAKNLVLWLVIAAVLLTVFNNFNAETDPGRLSYSDFVTEVQSDRVAKVVIDGYTIYGQRSNGERFQTIRPALQDPKLVDDLLSHKVVIEGKQPEQQSTRKILVRVMGCCGIFVHKRWTLFVPASS